MANQIPDCFYRVSVKALICDKQNRFLLVKEDNGFWELPGGGLDFGESPRDGLKREIWEEMKLNVTSISAQPSHFFTIKNHNNIFIANAMYEVQLESLNFQPTSECVEIRFFSSADVYKELKVYPNVLAFAKLFEKEPLGSSS
ncbi:NUDIX hydrolase [Cyclobacterium marinum]|uniref:NUDIX hydrolase n=1 Tax=Cyclobacterium marinum (strain ATCC 25205 / DSM 745 / LMG 13164 / NCIMB 1802) TaxID=880070 RepID=G0J562_CYCMS|nr:NUDIX hydrolase [Cyclobacterium marinum]AEL26746.1 NUDIX hydrolase [Cyclobacterium marinum DSM 745]MBI0400094.1 NUDIX hydrolase [Cyclobacterium marinum]